MKRFLLSLSTALVLLLTLAASVGAAGGTVTPSLSASVANGQPVMNATPDFGYYLWFAGDRVYLRTTDAGLGGPAVYTGTITVHGGTLHDVHSVQLDPGDWATASGNTLAYHFVTYGAVDGVDFSATGLEQVTFSLYRNGHLAATDHIFLGAGQVNPPGNPFTLFV